MAIGMLLYQPKHFVIIYKTSNSIGSLLEFGDSSRFLLQRALSLHFSTHLDVVSDYKDHKDNS